MAPDMKSNEQGVACWKGIEFRTKAGRARPRRAWLEGQSLNYELTCGEERREER